MSRRNPPAVALWLLDRLGFAGGNASLVGDLLEEFRNGRSVPWFWRQTLTVIANSVARRAGLLQIYWIAVVVGFAVQLPVSLLLFRLHLPRSAFVLMSIALAFVPFMARRVFGKSSKEAKLILLNPAARGVEHRPALMGAIAFESFGGMLLVFCVWCVLWSPAAFSSFSYVVVGELAALGIGEATSEVSLAATRIRASRRAAAEREWQTRVWPRMNQIEVSLICSDGTIALLKHETCIETIFASANEELIRTLFTGGVSFEKIRHAVWLAGAAEHGWPKRDPAATFAPKPLSRFARLLRDAPDSERMMRYVSPRLLPRLRGYFRRILAQ